MSALTSSVVSAKGGYIDAYGPRRLMWASDSPFQVQDGHTYDGSVELIRDRLDGVSDADREWLLTKTADRVFFS